MPMQCAYHPEREPVGACVECGRLICMECRALLGSRIYCTPCADKKFVQTQTGSVSTTVDRQPVFSVPATPPGAAVPPTTNVKTAASAQSLRETPLAAGETIKTPVKEVSAKKERKKLNKWVKFILIILGVLIGVYIIAGIIIQISGLGTFGF